MATLFADLSLKASKEGLSHETYLLELAKHEEEQRNQRRTTRLLRASGLPSQKTFRTDRGFPGSRPRFNFKSSG